jgi:hypothetical protein
LRLSIVQTSLNACSATGLRQRAKCGVPESRISREVRGKPGDQHEKEFMGTHHDTVRRARPWPECRGLGHRAVGRAPECRDRSPGFRGSVPQVRDRQPGGQPDRCDDGNLRPEWKEPHRSDRLSPLGTRAATDLAILADFNLGRLLRTCKFSGSFSKNKVRATATVFVPAENGTIAVVEAR